MMTPAKARSLLDGRGKAAAKFVEDLERWLEKNGEMAESVAGTRGGWPIWDEVTTASLLGMTTTRTFPRPSLRDDMTFDHAHPAGTLDWVTEIDADRLWADLLKKLDKARDSKAR
jgi:hypothetical protein